MQTQYHIPALLEQTIEGLAIRPDGTYIDVTFGGGGHSRAIFARLGNGGRLFSMDQDDEAQANGESLRAESGDKQWQFVHGNFRYLENYLDYYGVDKVDGVLADLGVSFHHFDEAERGFSFRFDGPLDMRMNRLAKRSAAEVIATYEQEALAKILFEYGECSNARALARKIVTAREQQPIVTTFDLVNALGFKDIEGHKKELARIFQALRMEVNDELGALRSMLEAARDHLTQGGRLAVLTYHSLEDRIVKNFMRSGNLEGIIEKDFYGNIVTPFRWVVKGEVADDDEVQANPRSRSARLRVVEKI